ncbi:ergothioneine biosynthesis protein EgtB [Sapientia aquatica]|uniref:Ergothioneine biosynthesis protein EgtB n=1 Tax=Sapientia aquatica TaxID=1549640 RepID=A0A4R5W6C0_9BURK|nr:ergothioneine biosynthesis protein EgtB [Sapientia aquatica]TDK68490.1 ergothioneine biosynthesis protein EgtB [Sapientia aquatica]
MQNNQANANITANLLEQFNRSRSYTTSLIKGLTPEDCQAQSMPDASPAKWHLAHVTWFYEVMVLKPFEPNFQYWNPQFAILFNSYYNGVGDKHPRHQRGLLTRPTLTEVLHWRQNIEQRIARLLTAQASPELQWLIQLGINHEQQHQELLLTDIQHLFSNNSLLPAYSTHARPTSNNANTMEWIAGVSGLVEVGFKGDGFHFDNEAPVHPAINPVHSLSKHLVSNAQWLEFIQTGGYRDPQWWLDAGWAWIKSEQISAPLYWSSDAAERYSCFSLNGYVPIALHEPVSNISYFEADAFARWASKNLPALAGARLPTEFEWESFAREKAHLAEDLFGQVWQWTSSNYTPYPGYQPWGGIAGEYNGKFMINQMVLRGSSAYTSAGHSRLTYRNFFPTQARWQMTGLRLAKDGL